MASPSASERRSFTYARWVLYGSTRGGAGGFSWSWPAGKPHRGHSHWSGIAASDAKLGLVSCPFEHQNDTQVRGAASPRSASPIGPAPTLLPRIALPLLTDHLIVAVPSRQPRDRQPKGHQPRWLFHFTITSADADGKRADPVRAVPR